MKKKLWIPALLALILLLPGLRAKADGLVISPGPGANTPRVVDMADIFTDEEEYAIELAIEEQSARGNADIVVVTDVTSNGMSHMEYADDYYDYNGYGFGPDRDGILLFICMEPGNRGWWTSVTGRMDPSVGSGPALYTESVANTLDDALYDYMVAGRYGDGVKDWVGNVGTWLTYGVPFAPMWYPTIEEQATWVREHKESASRVVDSAGLFSKRDADALEDKAEALADKYGADVVIHTVKSDYGMGADNYAKAFYQYGGYGLGSDYSGVLLVMFGNGYYDLYTEGNVPGCLEDYESATRLLELTAEDAEKNNSAAKGGETFLKLLEKAFKSNKIPHSTGTWIMSAIMAAVAGLIPGGISRGSASASMKTVRSAFDSNDYLVDGSFRIDGGQDVFVGVTTTRVYNPPAQIKTGSPGGGGGGGSVYSGGHISSSGSSHAGSGRKF